MGQEAPRVGLITLRNVTKEKRKCKSQEAPYVGLITLRNVTEEDGARVRSQDVLY